MHVDMIHLLMPHPPVVDDGTEAIGRAGVAGEAPGDDEHLAERRLVGGLRVVERRDVRFRHEQDMHRRLRADVVERDHLVVLVDLLRRDLAADDFAKNAIRLIFQLAHRFFRAAFSSMPEIPSRRFSSASTSPGPRPWRASTIMQWNQRSVVSRTICSLSPPFAASTVSVASSPIFFSIASSPLANKLAT